MRLNASSPRNEDSRCGFCRGNGGTPIRPLRSSAQLLESSSPERTRRDTVLWFDRDRGYGFIQTAGGRRNVIVHQTAVEQ
ncbi:MAG: cold shock domain-containing protein [Stellaceae bacterium]